MSAIKLVTPSGGSVSLVPENTAVDNTVIVPKDPIATKPEVAQVYTDLAGSGGAGLVGYLPAGTGAVVRTAQDKMRDVVTVKDFGALGNNTGDDAPLILASYAPYRMPRGTYRLQSSLKYRKDSRWVGDGKSFGGTILLPTGNFPALEPDTSVSIDYTKNDFSDFQIDASNISSEYALKIDDAYLTSYSNIWIRNAANGILITNSDSISFHNVMVMENNTGVAAYIGDNARSIKFHSCNFETNPGNTGDGSVIINGLVGPYVANADFYGCQLERSDWRVESGTGRWYGGKIGAQSQVYFGSRSLDCHLDANIDSGSSIHDFGYNNTIRSAYSSNMQTPVFQWPSLIPEGNSTTFGTGGDEYLFCVTVGKYANTAATAAQIELKEGATVLAQSPVFDLFAAGASVGLTKRPTYTFISCVRSTSGAIGPTFTNCDRFAIRGGRSLLTNGTLVGGISGWSLTGATSTQDGNDDTVVTPSGAWRLYQDLANRLIPGRRYIVMAKYSGAAALVLGNASNGTAGGRPSFDGGLADIYDSDKIAQIAFEFKNGMTAGISIGNTSNAGVVTIKWVALIDMDEPVPGLHGSATFDPPSIAAGAQTTTTVSVPGAQLGDFVEASFSLSLAGVEMSAYVSAANTVAVLFKNGTAGAVDLGSGILRVRVVRR